VASIAVLPLVDLSGGQRDPDFADGMTDELITHLAQIRALRVISPASTARYKNTRKSLKQIGDELNVRSIVSASVFRSGSHVRLNVQLADARTEQTLWANRYEGPMQDVVTLQNELARSIAEQIAVSMTPAEQRRLSRSIPIDPEVYDAYTKGRVFLAKETGEGLSRAMSYFQDAIDRDPTYAKAYAGLADAYNAMTFYGMLIPSDGCPRARQAALEAIRLDPELGEAHVPLAYVYSQYDWDWSRAEAEYRRALDLNPNFDGAHEFYAEHLAAQGRIDEAIAQVKKRVEIDPVSWEAHEEYGWILYLGHRYGAAVAEYKNALDLAPDSVSTLEGLADVYAAAGRNDEAVAAYDAWAAAAGISGESRTKLTRAYAQLGMRGYWAERLKMEQAETAETGDVWPFRMATYYALLGDRDNAFSWLDKAFQERSSRMTLLNVNPIFDGLRSDARFQALLAKVGLTHGVAGYKS
ncbi:MAG TPA: tetratricopeptide repeat protein, partial [Thermoanaerobaculia bacterium]